MLTPEELYHQLSQIDPMLPFSAFQMLGAPCKTCCCGLREALEHGAAKLQVADSLRYKASLCRQSNAKALEILLHHPAIIAAQTQSKEPLSQIAF